MSGRASVELGPDLTEIFVPAAGLATRAGAFSAGRAGWLDKLEALAERESLDTDLSQRRGGRQLRLIFTRTGVASAAAMSAS